MQDLPVTGSAPLRAMTICKRVSDRLPVGHPQARAHACPPISSAFDHMLWLRRVPSSISMSGTCNFIIYSSPTRFHHHHQFHSVQNTQSSFIPPSQYLHADLKRRQPKHDHLHNLNRNKPIIQHHVHVNRLRTRRKSISLRLTTKR